jgi:hypothetical protein
MKIKQLIISIFFLFVYSLSFAHSLLPHENGFYAEHFPDVRNENETEHIHEHHCETPKESCIKHNDHCDDSIFDLLICLFSDVNINHSNCDIKLNVNHFEKITNANSSDLTLKTIHSQFSIYAESSFKTVFKINESCFYLFLDHSGSLIKDKPLRGPPIIS